jgi:hypothetical protein
MPRSVAAAVIEPLSTTRTKVRMAEVMSMHNHRLWKSKPHNE